MADKREKNFHRWAFGFGVCILIAFIYIICKYVGLLVNEREKYLHVIEKNEIFTVEMRGHRGNIYDCRGRLVSASLPKYILFMDLTIPYIHTGKGTKGFPASLDTLCYMLSSRFGEESPEALKKRLMAAYKRSDPEKCDNGVPLLKRKLSYDEYQEVLQMPLMRRHPVCGGRVVQERQNRENLFGNMAQRVVGAVYGLDSATRTSGRYGLEKYFDKELSGTKGIYLKRRVGDTYILRPITPAEDGLDIVMTLDMDMQDVCEGAVRDKLIMSGAESACMILMEVETGEIKAVVNLVQDSSGVVSQGTNMAFAMNNQPGSTFKTVCLMAALEHDDDYDSTSVMLVNGGFGVFGGTPVHDSHLYSEKYLPLSAVLARSSNVGMARLMEEVYGKSWGGWKEFSQDIDEIGFDQPIDIEINAIADPIIHRCGKYKGWNATTMTAMSRGYAVQTTPLYTLNFYNAIANDGYYVRPHLVSAFRRGSEVVKEFDVQKRSGRMCSRGTLEQIKGMLEGVVSRTDGTAHRFVSSELFSVAGKTGTAQYRKVNGQWQYQISFVGYFPADKPKYSAIVVFMCPKQAYTGMYCGGVFKQVAETVWSMDQAR